MVKDRDVALVLSGGGMNAVLLELGFLKRLRESPLWPRIGWIYGTSAGALTGVMAALDRLDDLEEFCLGLQPDETFRPHRLWQLPFTGLHDYVLPATISERIEPAEQLVADLHESPIELAVCVTDITSTEDPEVDHAFERVYSSRTTEPAVMGAALHGVGGDQRPRASRAGRGRDRHRRRLGAELPARARLRQRGTCTRSSASATSPAIRSSAARTWRGCAAGWSRSAPSRRCARSSASCRRRRPGRSAASPRTWPR